MQPNFFINQILGRSDTLLYLWCFYVAIGLALLVVAARSTHAHPALPRFLFFGFTFFAVTHLLSLVWLLKQWSAAAAALKHTIGWEGAIEGVKTSLAPAIEPPAGEWVLPFHLAFDAFVLAGIWWLTRKRGP